MSQGNITESPMASGGGLKDLILRCLVFGSSGSSWRTTITTTTGDDGETKKKYVNNEKYMSHLVFYKWICRT